MARNKFKKYICKKNFGSKIQNFMFKIPAKKGINAEAKISSKIFFIQFCKLKPAYIYSLGS